MGFEEFKNHLIQAASAGTLMTPKHNPDNLGTSYASFRTVLSHELANNLSSFINFGNFSVKRYEHTKHPNSPDYYEITPNSDSGFTVPSSGVTANSLFASTTVDKIIAISGQTNGWHLFGEDSSVIRSKIRNGDLIFKNNLI